MILTDDLIEINMNEDYEGKDSWKYEDILSTDKWGGTLLPNNLFWGFRHIYLLKKYG
jgi:hypothetical protein